MAQGPGGYGGGPQGGPPGGYGGAPPGGGPPGYGGPPAGGAPPGYGAPQPYGPPQAGPGPGPTPPQKKSSPLLWVGLGCGMLGLIGLAAAGAVYYFVTQKAKAVTSAIEGLSAPSAAAPGVAVPGSVSGACAKVAACCKAMQLKSGGTANPASCDGFLQLPDATCQQQYQLMKPAAGLLGASCE